ncbi:MAG: ATP-binding cassette domain-containing protein [Gemmatales bacterium]|nr:ATP-binding cassette domain-containing protein [Gemmatales bacterium]MDW8387716.1 ATP-binding cassette domain-containing protein [Gemmatales bacterium]
MSVISARNLSKTYRVFQKKEGFLGALRGLFFREYKEVRAVQDVSFDIEPGEIVAFLGPNGAGKTTTLKMLSGLIYPTSGQAVVLGHVPWERADAFRRRFSLVMGQKNQLWWDLPALDSFHLHREIYSIPRQQFERTVSELTELFGVQGLLRQPVRELSLGERMKMELIAALLHRPELLLLDEPTIGLDVVAQATIQRCLREYNRTRGVTMLLTSHYMRDVEALCSRVLIINHGRLIYDGALSGIVEQFGQTKVIKLRFADGVPPELGRFGEVQNGQGPAADLRVERGRVSEILSSILERYTVVDMSVQDPPLDQVIARVFQEGAQSDPSDSDADDAAEEQLGTNDDALTEDRPRT